MSEGFGLRLLAVGLVAAALAGSACGPRADAKPQARREAERRCGGRSARGPAAAACRPNRLPAKRGALRVRWETTPEKAEPAQPSGLFRLNAHSAISGRLLQPVVEQAGVGSGVGYVQQDPHVFYVVVESNQLNWTFTVEEAIGYP